MAQDNANKSEIWTIVETLDGHVSPWVGVFHSLDEAKLAVARSLEEILEEELKEEIEWSNFFPSVNKDGTGWVSANLEYDPDYTFYLTRVA